MSEGKWVLERKEEGGWWKYEDGGHMMARARARVRGGAASLHQGAREWQTPGL